TSPTTPKPRAAKKNNKCGVFGQVLLAAVAIAVSVVVTPAIGGGVLGGIGGSVAGSVASQGLGVATGIQDQFSWKGVALAGISGGVGAGIGSLGLDKIGGSAFLGDVARGVAGNALTQGIAVATGLQSKFDWAGVAVGGVVGGAVGTVGRELGVQSFAGNASAGNVAGAALAGTAGALAGAAARSLIKGTDFGDNILAVLPDAIGSTIGNLVATQVAGNGRSSNSGATAQNEPVPGEGGIAFNPNVLDRFRAEAVLTMAGGNVDVARRSILMLYGPSQGEAVANAVSPGQILHDITFTGGVGYDGTSDAVLTAGDYWSPDFSRYGHNELTGSNSGVWVDNSEVMQRAYVGLANFDRQLGLLGVASVGGGFAGAGVALAGGALGLGGSLLLVDSAVGSAASGIPVRSALGQENTVGTFVTDVALGVAGGYVLGGALGRVLSLAGDRVASAAAEGGAAKFLNQGFSPAQADYLAAPYEGMGHHFIPRRVGLPEAIGDSPLNVLKPSGISRGDFYELHYQVDRSFYGTAFPKSVGGTWSGRSLGLEKYSGAQRLWYASPTPLKVTVGGAAAAGAAGGYWYYGSDK
ncbi:hypothetical protein ACMGER_18080, partial [Sphingomonas sp. DT-204]